MQIYTMEETNDDDADLVNAAKRLVDETARHPGRPRYSSTG